MGYIHPTVKVGVGALIASTVTIEAGCHIGPYSILEGDTHIGPDNKFYAHTIIGGEPQDHKFKGGGRLTIGRGNTFREFVTVHVGHLTEGGTVIGDENMFLTDAHVGHDCKIGDHNFLANQVLLAGHVEMGNHINMSGNAGAHQFCHIGSHAMISGLTGIRQDVPPYSMIQGDPARWIGINKIGLQRKGWSSEQLFQLREAFRCYRNGLELEGNPYYQELLDFKAQSERGVMRLRSKS